ncbi:hypothetical protein CPB83DRAFT_618717 [Crepidotus variabilis]|uniref:Methyltransferase domain-containing protein n=1 Tax=Crepidotus variabilis TaxID=179855 RepID=A0A9P6JKU7_9AGAR|nr:hypothetical protein CPB83DRAFT_618717 [Crepidotus variabilis]
MDRSVPHCCWQFSGLPFKHFWLPFSYLFSLGFSLGISINEARMMDTTQRTRANSVHSRTTTPTSTTPTPSFANSTGIVRKRHSAYFLPNSTHALLSTSSSTNSLDRLGVSSWKEGLALSDTTHTTNSNVQESNSTARPDRPPRNPARASTLGFEEMGLNGTPTPMSAASTSSHSLSSSPDLQKKTRPAISPVSGGWSKADVTPWEYQEFAPPSAGMMSENATEGGFGRRGGAEMDSTSGIVDDDEDNEIGFESRDGIQDLPSTNGKIHPKGGHILRGTEGSSHSTSGSHSGHGNAHQYSQYASSSSSGKQQAPSVRSRASSQGMANTTTRTTGPIEDVTPWELFPGPSPSASVVGSVGGMNGVATTSSSHSRSTRSNGPTNHNAMGATNAVGMSVTGISGPGMGSSLGLHPLVPAAHSTSASSTLSSLSAPVSISGSVTTPISLAGSGSIAHSVSGSSAISARGSTSDLSSIGSPLPTAIPTGQMLNPYPTALKQRKNTNASSTTANTTYTNNTSGTNGTGVTGGSGGGASTATGPVEDVLPWELSPPPPSPPKKGKSISNGVDKRKSEDALGFTLNGKVTSDDEKAGGKSDKEKTSRRDKLSQKLKPKRPMSLAPIKGSAFSSQSRIPSGAHGPTSQPLNGQEDGFPPSLAGPIGGTINGLLGGPTSAGSTSSNPPVSPSRRSEHSSRSSGDWGAGGGRHGSIIPRSPPSKKLDLPPQMQRATSRQLPLTGPVEDVAPWEMEEHNQQPRYVQAQPSQQASKQRSSMSLGGESKSSANHHGNSNNQSFAVPLPSPSFFFAMGNQPPNGILTGGGSRSAGSGIGMHGKSGSHHHSLSAQAVNKHAMNEDAASVASIGTQSVGEKERGEKGRKRANSVAASLAASLVSVASAISGDSQAIAAAANASSSSHQHHTPASKRQGRPRTADSALSTTSGYHSLGNDIHAAQFGNRRGGSAVSLALSTEFDKKSFGTGNAVAGRQGGSEEGEIEEVPALHDFSSGHAGRAKNGSRPSSAGGSVKALRPSSTGSNSGSTPIPLNGSSHQMSGAVPMAIASSTSTGATSIVSSMSMAQMEEVTPWELYPSPAATPAARIVDEMGMVAITKDDESSGHDFGQAGTVNGIEIQRKGRKTSRPSTSSNTSKTLADFGLRRRRSTGGKTSNAQGGAATGLAGAAAAAANKDTGSGSALTPKGISNAGISYTPADFRPPGTSLAPPPTITAVASTSSTSSAHSRSSKPKGSSVQGPTIPSDANVAKFSTADRTILEELKANIRAREAQFVIKGVGHTIVGGGKCPGKKHHPYSKKEVPYPRSYDTEVVDLDVWETMFCLDVGKSLTWHVFESPPTKVLEIGCGTGTWILHCARTWKDCTFVGLDIVPLHPNLQNVGSPDLASRITWVQHNFLEGPLPFQNEEFDFVHIKRIALGVPENKWDDFFEELQRVMKPGGAFEMIEEDLFFPGKSVDEYDDTMSLKSDGSSRKTSISSMRERASTINGVDDSSTLAETVDSPSTPKTTHGPPVPRPSTPTKHRDTETKNTSPGSDRSTGSIVLPHSRSVARPSLHIKTHDAKLPSQDHKWAARPSTSQPNVGHKPKTTPFLLRSLATTAAPHNPRDHTILAAIWNGMLESRFVNASPLSLLTAYLEYHFRDVRSHPIQYTFPIPPPPKPEDDHDLPLGADPLKTPKPSAKSPALSSFRSMQPISRNLDYSNDQSTPIARHQSSFASFDDTRIRSSVRAGSTGKALPNTVLKFEGRTLNLQLSLRAKEIIACSEPMWEWVEEFQVSQLQSKGSRYRSGSIETALLGSNGSTDGRMSADITRNAILEMTRDDFDQMLNNFQMDMQDKACVGYALEQRFDWRTFELEPLQDRKAFDEANRKYDQWLASHRKPHVPAPTTHRSRVSLSHPNAGLPPVDESTRPSVDDSASLATATTLVQSIRPPHEISIPPPTLPRSLYPHPSSQLSRAIRIFVAWKSPDKTSL